MSGRPYTLQQRVHKRHPTISEEELIKKKDLLDPLDDNDDIEWKANLFDSDSLDGSIETPEELMSKITFKGSPQLQSRLKALVLEFIDVFATKVRREPAAVEPMKLSRKQINALLKLGVIKESRGVRSILFLNQALCSIEFSNWAT